jgi:Growth inhibitor
MNQGEIWLVDLDPTIGAEMNKTRPALIMSDNKLGTPKGQVFSTGKNIFARDTYSAFRRRSFVQKKVIR